MVGCRAGSQCPFRHIPSKETAQEPWERHEHEQRQVIADSPVASDQDSAFYQARIPGLPPITIRKPVSQLQQANPRKFQLGQVAKRFIPIRNEVQDATILSFTLAPSDPDFPFELEGGLQCELRVPSTFPQNGKPTIRVTNSGMPRGFQINVEKGFDILVEGSPQKTLLALLNDLDKNLEKFLTTEKAQTIKIVANSERRPKTAEPAQEPARLPLTLPISVPPIRPFWTSEQRSAALAKRQADVRQLEARMSRVPGFSKNSDGTTFNIPIHIAQPAKLPVNLQPLKEVTLLVPKLYNLEQCTVLLKGVGGSEAENVHMAFVANVREKQDMTLMAHVNYLTQNISTMATEIKKSVPSVKADIETQQAIVDQPQPSPVANEELETRKGVVDEERPHIHFVPRPPEWDNHDSDNDTDESSYYSHVYQSEEENDGEDEFAQGGASLPSAMSTSADKGVHLSFPNLESHNVELLTIDSLSLSVKCLRCKTPSEISNIKATGESNGSTASITRNESCSKCTTPFTFSFKSNALHANTIRAGIIDAAGCTITDMLPSVFRPTCSSCSTTFPVPPGMISVRGDTPIQVCRLCHAKMTFTIHEVKFLRVSHATTTLPLRRPKKENLGISAGTALPNNGTCPHYRRSYRWFRFSCCNRVHPCDRCHDAAEEHVNEHADRMICGWCSREQRFRKEDCGVCGRSVIRRRGRSGFWEGGQGTRDRKLMSKNEKRKYKRPSAKEAAAMQGKKH